jgi:hypothetical protein
MLQKTVSECSTLILLMTSYLIYNDDLFQFNFSSFNNSFLNDFIAIFTKILICVFSAFYLCIILIKVKKLLSIIKDKLLNFRILVI